MKLCRPCKTSKPRSAFHVRAASKDGLSAMCKACQSIYDAARANRPDRVAARKAYAATPEGKAALRRGSDAYDQRNPLKRKAVNAVNNAVRDGRLLKKPCEKCGNPKAQAHHDDYSKPLEVSWLCVKDHNHWHRHNTPKCPPQRRKKI